MFMLMNVVLLIVIYFIETKKGKELKVAHLIFAPLAVLSSAPGTLGLVLFIIFSNITRICKGLDTKVSDINKE